MPENSDSSIRQVVEQGSLRDVVELLNAPARSGLFLSRTTLKRLAQSLDLRIGILNRGQMLENLFREAGRQARLPELLDLLEDEAKAIQQRYADWNCAYPFAKGSLDAQSRRLRELTRCLRRLRRQARSLQRSDQS